ncbi:MAG: hypothetical protein FWG40_06135 [Peptococcaceae bacterium]|nr:hypothetical protein [Peptococcaceae bacterium]
MRVRKFFRQINRGIVLAIIVAIALTGYLIVDGVAFASEKTAIRDMLAAYAQEAETMSVLPEDVRQPGKKAPMSTIEKKMEQTKPIMEKYLTDSVSWNGSAYLNAQTSLEYALKENNDLCAYVTECKFDVTNVSKLRKITTDLAIGDVTVRANIQTIGRPTYLLMFMQIPADMNNGIFFNNKPGIGSEVDTTPHTYSKEITFLEVYFKKTNGTWKVAETNGGYWYR